MKPTEYLKYLSENIKFITTDKQENLQLVVEDFINDDADIDALSEAAAAAGLFGFTRFHKDIICRDILGE